MTPSFLRRAFCLLSAAAIVVLLTGSGAGAQIIETRQGDANPMVSVFKSTLYGGLAGLVLGLAIELADDDDDGGDAVRLGFVGGTFLGFGYGIYHVTSRSRPGSALLEGNAEGWEWSVPSPVLAVATVRPDVDAAVGPPPARAATPGLRASLVGWTF